MSSDIAIDAEHIGKCYHIYDSRGDRLKQFIWPLLQRVAGLPPKLYYREFWALNDISFAVEKKGAVGIIGKNGSGKSTLLQLVCGTLAPTVGSIKTNGRIAALLELGSGFNPEFTGRDNVYLSAAIYGLTKDEIDRRIDRIIEFSEIGDFIDQPVKTYSSGMFVRLAFAVIAHVDAEILIIDEALSVGDAAFSRKCIRFLRKFMENNTVLFVSHDTSSVKSLCNRAIWIDSGKIMADGDPKSVSDAYLKHLYDPSNRKPASMVDLNSVTPIKSAERLKQPRDMRQQFLNSTNLRNDIQVFQMTGQYKGFGQGGVSIIRVSVEDDNGNPLAWVVGGEFVQIKIKGQAHQFIEDIIVGFTVKDRLGQYLFGDNTYLVYSDAPLSVSPDETFTAIFQFTMPILRAGSYTIDVAVASGTQSDHVQLFWAIDAMEIRSITSSVCSGLIGIPIEKISLSIE